MSKLSYAFSDADRLRNKICWNCYEIMRLREKSNLICDIWGTMSLDSGYVSNPYVLTEELEIAFCRGATTDTQSKEDYEWVTIPYINITIDPTRIGVSYASAFWELWPVNIDYFGFIPSIECFSKSLRKLRRGPSPYCCFFRSTADCPLQEALFR